MGPGHYERGGLSSRGWWWTVRIKLKHPLFALLAVPGCAVRRIRDVQTPFRTSLTVSEGSHLENVTLGRS